MTEPTAPDPGASAPPTPTAPPPQSSWPPPEQQPASWTPPPPELGPAPGLKFASHGPRLLAYIIDGLIIGIVLTTVIVILSIVVFGGSWMAGLRNEDFQDGNLSPAAIGTIVSFVFLVLFLSLLAFFYFPFFWARSGQTPGMKLFGLYVVRDSDGGKISGGQAILRLFGYWVSGVVFYLGFIWILIDARRRGWHDLIAGTVVIEHVPGS